MATVDELKILITGDTAGIASAVKQSINIVQGGVKQMNSQEVDWTGIFSRAVSPAIISSVASVFAFAIAQSVNFQTAMATTGTAAGQSSDQIAMMSKSALNLSTTVPSSAEDIAQAMAQVSAIFGSTADQALVVQAMAQLAASGFGDLSDITAASVDVFKQFGVTTTDQAINVLTSLMHAAEGAKETIPALASQFSSFSDQLPGANKNLTTFNGLISNFASEVANLGAKGAQQLFSALAASSNSAVGPMELLGISFGDIQKSLLNNGGLDAIARASTILDKMGPSASLIATQFGLSAAQVGQFQTNASKLDEVAKDANDIAHNTQSIKMAFDQANVGTNKLLEDWNAVKASFLDSTFWNGVAGLFVGLVGQFAKLITNVNKELDALVNSNSFSDLLNAVAGPLQYQTTPALPNGMQAPPGFSQNGPQLSPIMGTKQGANSNSVSNLIFNNSFNINGSVGTSSAVKSLSGSISDQLYSLFQGAK